MTDFFRYEEQLRQGLNAINLSLDSEKISQLINYLKEFHKWNKAYNLSAIRELDEMVSRHLLDSLVLVPFVKNFCEEKSRRIIDVGTGGGLPGIPLAIAFPETNFVLLDSNGKKTRFLFQVKTLLKLNNVTIENTRAENYKPEQLFDMVISRAFASIKDMVDNSKHLISASGEFWAMKGIYPEKELREAEKQVMVSTSQSLVVPDTEGERHLIILKPIIKRTDCE